MKHDTIKKLRSVAAEAERCGVTVALEPWEMNELLDMAELGLASDADTIPPGPEDVDGEVAPV